MARIDTIDAHEGDSVGDAAGQYPEAIIEFVEEAIVDARVVLAFPDEYDEDDELDAQQESLDDAADEFECHREIEY